MRTTVSPALAPSMEMRGSSLPFGATDCTTIHSAVARTIWPRKTAECWAEAAGVKVRMAKYWLAGREVSGDGRAAIAKLLL